MNVLSLDFETYYDREYSLKKMTMVEYIMDARFQPIMMCYSINGSPVQTAVGYPQIRDVLDSIDWNNTLVVALNTKFDGSILSLRFGKFAKAYVDVMAMARVTGFHVIAGGASLEKIADQLRVMGYPIPRKGETVKTAQGMHLYDIYGTPYLAKEKASTPYEKTLGVEMLEQYKRYCQDDVLLTQCAFDYFKKLVLPQEMAYGDMILKCYIKPQFYLDLGIIQSEIKRIEERDREKIADVARNYFYGDTQLMRETMRSVPKFTKFLQQIGGVFEHECGEDVISPRFFVPVKYSEKKGIVQPCYAKTHPPVLDLLEGDDEELSTIFSMKLALTSSIEMTRAKRFEGIAKLGIGFGMPYEVSGAHTHRLGGCVVADTKVLVLTDYGCITEKNITDVLLSDLVWDGEEFCEHEGVVFRGYQEVITHDGITGTRDHKCFVNEDEAFGLAELAEQGTRIMDCPTPEDWGINLNRCGAGQT